MQLTKEEYTKLRENIAAIQAYIENQIIPHLYGTSVTVRFGPVVEVCSPPWKEQRFWLSVSKDGVSGGAGYYSTTLLPTDGNHIAFTEWTEAGIELIREWHKTVKPALVTHVHKCLDEKIAINNFTV